VTTVLYARDDLESLGYVMAYFLQGQLPWCGLKERGKNRDRLTMEMKQSLNARELFDGFPAEFAEYLDTVKSLEYQATPDYARMEQAFRKLAEKKGIEYDNVYDWTIILYLQQGEKKKESK
jgi:hypothetical protein